MLRVWIVGIGVAILLLFMIVSKVSAQGVCGLRLIESDGLCGTNGVVKCAHSWDPDGPAPQPMMVVVGGEFQSAGDNQANNIALWNSQTGDWSSLGVGFNNEVRAVTVLSSGDIVAGGLFTASGSMPVQHIARWNFATNSWSSFPGGIAGDVYSLLALPNGDFVAGGFFQFEEEPVKNWVVRWNSVSGTWTSLGTGVNNIVYALAALPNGNVVASGDFTSAGGQPVGNIAVWNVATSTWNTLGGGTDGSVFAVTTLPSGDIIAGGNFETAGGVNSPKAARWSNAANQWVSIGSSTSGAVLALRTLQNGEVVAGGSFFSMGSAGPYLARYSVANGWLEVGGGTTSEVQTEVHSLGATPSGGFVAGGYFQRIGTLVFDFVALRDSQLSQWIPMGKGPHDAVTDMIELPGGNIIAAGSFRFAGSAYASGVARRNVSTGQWSAFGAAAANSFAHTLSMTTGGDLFMSTTPTTVSRWTQFGWTPVGTTSSAVNATLADANGGLIAAGSFTSVSGVPANRIARWNGVTWSPLGMGIASGNVFALARMTNGDIVAAGGFLSAGAAAANRIARWNGSSWNTLSSGIIGSSSPIVHSLTVLPNSDLIAGGFFDNAGGYSVVNIARWNGAAWSAMGAGLFGGHVYALTGLQNNDVIAGGNFNTTAGNPARFAAHWDHTSQSWSALDEPLDSVAFSSNDRVASLLTLSNGDVLVGGSYVSTNDSSPIAARFARWTLPLACRCDSIDFNNDNSLFDPQDIEAFLSVYSEGACVPPPAATCNDIDFNNDTSVFDPCDINAFLVVYSEGPCTACGG